MKKSLYILILSSLIILSGCSTTQYLPESDLCKDLNNRFAEEYSKIDFSCKADEDCTNSNIGCSCKRIGADTSKIEEIRNIEIEKGCKPQIECMPFNCKCKNNLCSSEIIPREEWGW